MVNFTVLLDNPGPVNHNGTYYNIISKSSYKAFRLWLHSTPDPLPSIVYCFFDAYCTKIES